MMNIAKKIPDLGPLEYRLLRIVWENSPVTAREVLTRYNSSRERPLKYTTVMTLLTRLVDKGVLRADRSRQPFHFSARISRDRVVGQRVHDFVDLFFEGRAVDLAVRLVENEEMTPESLRRLERILQRHRESDAPDSEDS